MDSTNQISNNFPSAVNSATLSESIVDIANETEAASLTEIDDTNYLSSPTFLSQRNRRILINTHMIDIKLKGVTNGVLDVPPSFFEEWIIRDNDLDFLADKLQDNETRLKSVKGKIQDILSKRVELKNKRQQVIAEVKEAEMKLTVANEKVLTIKNNAKSLEKEIEQFHRPYLGIMGYVYLAGCILMILTDIEILDKIFDALGVPRGEGLFSDPRLKLKVGFAAAMIAIKPAFDFVIDNYQFNEPNFSESNIKLRKIVYISIASLVLATISFMSWHRSFINEDGDVIRSGGDSIQLAIFLSGPAFALAGTLLLSLAHRNFKIWFLRRQKINELKELVQTKLNTNEKILNDCVSDKLKKESILLSLEVDSSLESDLPLLFTQSESLQTEILEIKATMNKYLNEKEIAIYRDALEVGKKYELQGKLIISPSELHEYADTSASSLNSTSNRNGSSGVKNRNSFRPRRPYVMLRKLIAKNAFKSNAEQIDVSDN